MTLNPDVFKAYDIRGRTDRGEITDDLAARVGQAVYSLTGSDPILVGRDSRLSSTDLSIGVERGVNEMAGNCWDLGVVPTDLVYVLSGLKQRAGIMVTASHNPPEYNGFKICGPGALPVGADNGLSYIRQYCQLPLIEYDRTGSVKKADCREEYLDHLLAQVSFPPEASGEVVVDGGNGAAGSVIPLLFGRLPFELSGLYLEPDGEFPNHPPDPLDPANLADLQQTVRDRSAILGVAFDGDADRAFFIDETGSPLTGSTTTALIARWFLRQHPGAVVVHNLITSRAVPELIRSSGGRPVRTRVGHSFIKQIMRSEGALFGGEHSGHYYFAQNFYADSGVLALLVLLSIVAESDRPLSQLRQGVERYCGSGELNFRIDDPAYTLTQIADLFPGGQADHLDGVTLSWPDCWFNLRASHTEPLLRFNAEADSSSRLEELVGRVKNILEDMGGVAA